MLQKLQLKKMRLDKRKAALANESVVQRTSRLQNACEYKQQLFNAESLEHKEARLHNMRILNNQYLEAESDAVRQARLLQMKMNQRSSENYI